jgi:hypothetical protein
VAAQSIWDALRGTLEGTSRDTLGDWAVVSHPIWVELSGTETIELGIVIDILKSEQTIGSLEGYNKRRYKDEYL